MRKNYSKEDKQKVINLCSDGVSVSEISKEYGLARSTIYAWVKEYNETIRRRKPIDMHEVLLLRQQCEQQNLIILGSVVVGAMLCFLIYNCIKINLIV